MSERSKKKPTSDKRAVLPEWMVKRLDFPPEILRGGMRIELRGRESLLVEGCRQILLYTPTIVKLQMRGCCLVIEGERLLCHSYLSGAVGLEGHLVSFHFEEAV